MKNRSLAIALTVITALVCLCLALAACLAGGVSVYMNGQTNVIDLGTGTPYQVQPFTTTVGAVFLCVSVLLALVPVIVAVIALRKPKAETAPLPPGEPLPPAS